MQIGRKGGSSKWPSTPEVEAPSDYQYRSRSIDCQSDKLYWVGHSEFDLSTATLHENCTSVSRVFHELTRMRHGLLTAIPSPSLPDPPRSDRSPHLARGWWLGADWRLGAVMFGWQLVFGCRLAFDCQSAFGC